MRLSYNLVVGIALGRVRTTLGPSVDWLRCWLVGVVGLACLLGPGPARAQVAVSDFPPSYTYYNNTGAGGYVVGVAQGYLAPPVNLYKQPPVTPAGAFGAAVPNTTFSEVILSAPAGQLDRLLSTVINGGVAPNNVAPAGLVASFGQLVAAYPWGSADVVMQQCFGGGFAFNVDGALQGVIAVGPPRGFVPPANSIPYTFAAAANFNEAAWNYDDLDPPPPLVLANFTQGQAYAEVPGGLALAPFGMYRAFDNGRIVTPYTNGAVPYGAPVKFDLGILKFESPVYASPDPLVGGAIAAGAANNGRTYPQLMWAVLAAFSPNKSRFSLNIQRQYAALIANGVPQNHIAVLYGDCSPAGADCPGGTLPTVAGIAAANDRPSPTAIFPAGFNVPVQGATTRANLQGLLNPRILYPFSPQNYWQALFDAGADGATPSADGGDRVLVYTTGHGGAWNVIGGKEVELDEVNPGNGDGGGAPDAGPAGWQVKYMASLPDNDLAASENDAGANTSLAVQITSRTFISPSNLSNYQVSLGNISLGAPLAAGTPGGNALDMSSMFPASAGNLYYYVFDASPVAQSTPLGQSIPLTITSTVSSAKSDIQQFAGGLLAVTFLNGSTSTCATGACDTYSDLKAAPAMQPWSLALLALLLGGASVASMRKRRVVK